MNDSVIKIDFSRRKQLEEMLGADHVSFCYQCGACVGDCPSARFHKGFNPRTIMMRALMGDVDELIGPDSIIWLCSNCYNCYQRCPQDVRPVEVIVALKNLSARECGEDDEIVKIAQRVRETGRSVPVTQATQRMRKELGLAPLEDLDVSELEIILREDEPESVKEDRGG